jgi:mevalonate kinase
MGLLVYRWLIGETLHPFCYRPNMTMKSLLSVPSKAFLIGEYAVLSGAPAIVATFSPRFTLGPRNHSEQKAVFHPDSPAGRLLKANRWEGIWEFRDPYLGAGGFGGSTAEFLLGYAISQIKSEHSIQAPVCDEDAWHAWSRYKEFTPQASGADLIAQWLGGTVHVDLKEASAKRMELGDLGRCILIFSAAHQEDRKVKTHEHLANDATAKFKASQYLLLLIERAHDAIGRGNVHQFTSSINQYGDLLREAGFEIEATTRDREAIIRIPGVIGVKGTGALQADGLVVVVDPLELDKRDEIVCAIEKRDLRCLTQGLNSKEPGITIE